MGRLSPDRHCTWPILSYPAQRPDSAGFSLPDAGKRNFFFLFRLIAHCIRSPEILLQNVRHYSYKKNNAQTGVFMKRGFVYFVQMLAKISEKGRGKSLILR
jgi:hypothetical protein